MPAHDGGLQARLLLARAVEGVPADFGPRQLLELLAHLLHPLLLQLRVDQTLADQNRERFARAATAAGSGRLRGPRAARLGALSQGCAAMRERGEDERRRHQHR